MLVVCVVRDARCFLLLTTCSGLQVKLAVSYSDWELVSVWFLWTWERGGG